MAELLEVADDCAIPLSEIEWRFGPSGGPGGQHANRAHTRVEALFDVDASQALTPAQRARLRAKLGPVVRAAADDERSQARNRTLALERLARRMREALHIARPRRPTRPGRAAEARRIDAKRRRSEIKKLRGKPLDE